MILGFFRLIFYLLVALAVYVFLRILLLPRRAGRRETKRPPRSRVMVKDEVCNTYLPREDAIREELNGRDFFFCSPACRGKFLEQRKRGG